MPIYAINNREDAEAFGNRLVKFTTKKTFQPITIQANLGKTRSNPQNRLYFKYIKANMLPYFEEHPMDLIKLVLKAVGFGVNLRFLHELLKLIYLKGSSTTKNSTFSMSDYYNKINHDMYHDYGIPVLDPEAKN